MMNKESNHMKKSFHKSMMNKESNHMKKSFHKSMMNKKSNHMKKLLLKAINLVNKVVLPITIRVCEGANLLDSLLSKLSGFNNT